MEKCQDNKVVLLGCSGVGKTTLITRLFSSKFDGNKHPTIGVEFRMYSKVTPKGVKSNIGIWDTAGQDRFDSILPLYIRGSTASLVCTDNPDIETVQKYVNLSNDHSPNSLIYIVITKSDLFESTHPFIHVEEYADEIGAKVFVTSSMTGEGVQELFDDVADSVTIHQQKRLSESIFDQDLPAESRWCCG